MLLQLTFSVRNNTEDINGTTISNTFEAGGQYNYNGSIIVDLSEGDEIDLALESTTAATGNVNNASLNIKLLSPSANAE